MFIRLFLIQENQINSYGFAANVDAVDEILDAEN